MTNGGVIWGTIWRGYEVKLDGGEGGRNRNRGTKRKFHGGQLGGVVGVVGGVFLKAMFKR